MTIVLFAADGSIWATVSITRDGKKMRLVSAFADVPYFTPGGMTAVEYVNELCNAYIANGGDVLVV